MDNDKDSKQVLHAKFNGYWKCDQQWIDCDFCNYTEDTRYSMARHIITKILCDILDIAVVAKPSAIISITSNIKFSHSCGDDYIKQLTDPFKTSNVELRNFSGTGNSEKTSCIMFVQPIIDIIRKIKSSKEIIDDYYIKDLLTKYGTALHGVYSMDNFIDLTNKVKEHVF